MPGVNAVEISLCLAVFYLMPALWSWRNISNYKIFIEILHTLSSASRYIEMIINNVVRFCIRTCILACCRRHSWCRTIEDKWTKETIKTIGLWGSVLLWRIPCLLHQEGAELFYKIMECFSVFMEPHLNTRGLGKFP